MSKTYTRRTFYGKQGGKNPFIYEHTIPAGVIREELIKRGRDDKIASQILAQSGVVAVILRKEDEMLRKAGYSSRMPIEWKIGGDHLARYKEVGIKLSNEVLKVKGAICR